jgi:hypothetical protein
MVFEHELDDAFSNPTPILKGAVKTTSREAFVILDYESIPSQYATDWKRVNIFLPVDISPEQLSYDKGFWALQTKNGRALTFRRHIPKLQGSAWYPIGVDMYIIRESWGDMIEDYDWITGED